MPLICIASPKGGVGKTTLTAHIAAILAARGHRVLALDLDPQNALRLHLGLPMQEEGGLMAELAQDGGRPWSSLVQRTPFGPELLPYGHLDPVQVLEFNQRLFVEPALLAGPVRAMLADPRLVLLVDSPPGPGPALSAIMPLVHLTVMVLLADGGSAALLPQIASGRILGRGTMAARMAARLAVVLNQVDLGSPLSTAVLEAAERALGPRLLGAIGYDAAVAEALADKRLLLQGGEGASVDMQQLASMIASRAELAAPGGGTGPGRGGAGFAALADWGLQ